jgi:DNA-directed RNA polymerase alpha subunit
MSYKIEFTSSEFISIKCLLESSSFPADKLLLDRLNNLENSTPSITTRIVDLSISRRTKSCLATRGIKTVSQIIGLGERELYKIPNFGNRSMADLKGALGLLSDELTWDGLLSDS